MHWKWQGYWNSNGNQKAVIGSCHKNPYEGYLKQDKIGKLISTKNDFRRHGYGISSIQKVADKYGGDVIIETQDGKFVLTVMMNIGIFNS